MVQPACRETMRKESTDNESVRHMTEHSMSVGGRGHAGWPDDTMKEGRYDPRVKPNTDATLSLRSRNRAPRFARLHHGGRQARPTNNAQYRYYTKFKEPASGAQVGQMAP